MQNIVATRLHKKFHRLVNSQQHRIISLKHYGNLEICKQVGAT